MARALQCPKCGARNGADVYAGRADFACPSCGQRLKVPEALRSAGPTSGRSTGAASAAPGARSGGTAPQKPAPTGRRATASASAASTPGAASATAGAAPRGRPRLVWRMLAWAVAVFLGGFIVFVVGRAVGYLDGQRALDIVISTGLSRYAVLLPLVPIWAVVTTVLVTIFIDGGQALARRSRSRRGARPTRDDPTPASPSMSETPASSTPDAHGVTDDPPPTRRTGASRRAGGHPD